MKVYNQPEKAIWQDLLSRPTQSVTDIEETVSQVFDDVQKHGDKAILKYTSMFDAVDLKNQIVSQNEINQAVSKVSTELKTAIDLAKHNIEAFHEAQRGSVIERETTTGVRCWQEKRPIEKVGLYIPGGTAPLFSSVLMLAIPARIAGCQEMVLCTPPGKNGQIADEILYTAQLCGITQIIKVGGIQAIAGLTFGTETISQVYKIFGPGNQFVTVAKQLATKYGVAIDMPAGPSELLVLADETANAAYVASDLLSQAEHGVDSQVILVSTSSTLIDKVLKQVKVQLANLPRKSIADQAIAHSKCIYLESKELALELVNSYAPEHLIICVKDEDFYTKGLINAGSVFLGNYTPESAGDYASGTNHTLPTNGFSRAYSGVNLDSFMKSMTFQKITADGIRAIGPAIELMAEAEGLQAHKNAVTLRLKDLN